MDQRQLQQLRTKPAAWTLYFGEDTEYTHDDRRAMLVNEIAAFFDTQQGWDMLCSTRQSHPGGQYVLELDFDLLSSRCFCLSWCACQQPGGEGNPRSEVS